LQELVLAIRDDAPTPDAGYELRMNARVAAGFPPRRGGASGRIRALLTTRPQMAALGVAASLLIALVIVASNGGGSGSPTNVQPTSAVENAPASTDSAGGSAGGGSSSAETGAQVKAQAPAAKAVRPSESAGSVASDSVTV